MTSLLLWVLSWFSQPILTERVAVEAAFTLHTAKVEPVKKVCCGACKNGFIIHGDGHRTPCPCPPDCKCKQPAAPPPAQPIVQPPARKVGTTKCVNGQCVHRT
jgi:hypothetical protein